jgi:hypothetical protein
LARIDVAPKEVRTFMKQIRLFFAVFTITAAVALQVHAQDWLTNGLVGCYPFSGNANDMVGTNNGTVYGAVLATDRFGIPNSAYSFNGSSSYIDCGSPAALAFTSNFTVTAWCLFSGGSLQNPVHPKGACLDRRFGGSFGA